MKKLKGKIVSLKGDKTASVEITKMWAHPLYGKRIRQSTKYACDYDPKTMKLNEGDFVEIQECRPISKTKSFKVTTIFEKQ